MSNQTTGVNIEKLTAAQKRMLRAELNESIKDTTEIVLFKTGNIGVRGVNGSNRPIAMGADSWYKLLKIMPQVQEFLRDNASTIADLTRTGWRPAKGDRTALPVEASAELSA